MPGKDPVQSRSDTAVEAVGPRGQTRSSTGSGTESGTESAPGPNGRATRSATRSAPGRAPEKTPPARGEGEDFFDYLLRPDVAPFVRNVSLVRLDTAEGGRPLRDPPIRFGHAPTMTEVLGRVTVPGYYECYAHRDGGIFLSSQVDTLLNITEAMLEEHEDTAEVAATDGPPAGDNANAVRLVLDDARLDLRHMTEARESERRQYVIEAREHREEHEEKVERLTAANADRIDAMRGTHAEELGKVNAAHVEQLATLKSGHAEALTQAKTGTRDGTAMDGFTKAAEIFGGSSMDLKASEAIRDKARAEGHTTGMVEGKAAAYADARAAAREELSGRLEELDKRKADLERREAKQEKQIAGVNDGATERAAALDKRKASLEAYAKQLGAQTAKYKAAAAKITAAREDLDAREADLAGREDQLTAIGDPRAGEIAEAAMPVDPDDTFGDFEDLFDDMVAGDGIGGPVADSPQLAAAAPATPATPVVPVADPMAAGDLEIHPPTAEELELALGPD